MEFESIGGSSSERLYSLYDYSTDPMGETIMVVAYYPLNKTWRFQEVSSRDMNELHMKALQNLLVKLLK